MKKKSTIIYIILAIVVIAILAVLLYFVLNRDTTIKEGETGENSIKNETIISQENSQKSIKEEVVFGISPEGNINNNYDSNYIDTKKILSEEGYVDYIMPQVYFGFLNEVMPFMETVSMWNSLIKVNNIKLIPALAFYKVGTTDEYAKGGSNEWIENNDIIKKQVLISRNVSNYGGFSLFRYDYLFNDEYLNDYLKKEKDNLKDIL